MQRASEERPWGTAVGSATCVFLQFPWILARRKWRADLGGGGTAIWDTFQNLRQFRHVAGWVFNSVAGGIAKTVNCRGLIPGKSFRPERPRINQTRPWRGSCPPQAEA